MLNYTRVHYREPSGDYLVVDLTNRMRAGKGYNYEARSSVITGDPKSIATSMVHSSYLDECVPVDLEEIPEEWKEHL